MAYDFAYPQTRDAEARGWGQGWPNCNTANVVSLAVDGVSFPGGIREELHELVTLLVTESLKRGYIPRLDDPGCWGGGCRPTKRADGSLTDTPSNHSWFTAVDINAPHNVFGSSTHQIPQVMADLWRDFGWRWLGPPIGDWMHFDYAGTPEDAARDTVRAREAFAPGPTEDDEMFEDWKTGWDRHEAGKPFSDAWPAGVRQGWRDRSKVLADAREATKALIAAIPPEDVATVPEHSHSWDGKITVT